MEKVCSIVPSGSQKRDQTLWGRYSVSAPTFLDGGMDILGVDVFIRLGVRYANMLGRLLYIPLGSTLALGRLGDTDLPVYRIY